MPPEDPTEVTNDRKIRRTPAEVAASLEARAKAIREREEQKLVELLDEHALAIRSILDGIEPTSCLALLASNPSINELIDNCEKLRKE